MPDLLASSASTNAWASLTMASLVAGFSESSRRFETMGVRAPHQQDNGEQTTQCRITFNSCLGRHARCPAPATIFGLNGRPDHPFGRVAGSPPVTRVC